MPDHDTYPGTEVLVNLPGIVDPDEWKAAETAVVGQRLVDLLLHPIPGPGDTGIAHCRPEFIPAEAERIFNALAQMDHLRGRSVDGFSRGLARVWGEMTALHPFRDQNTRSQFVFFNQLAERAGWVIDWGRIDPYVFAHARTVAIVRDEAGIDALLHPALFAVNDADRRDGPDARLPAVAEHFFTAGRTPASSQGELDERLSAAIARHRNQTGFGGSGPH